MIRFITSRFGLGLLSLGVFLFLMYVLIEALIPGDIVTPLRMGMTGQEMEELRRDMGLDRALPIRFWRWLSAAAAGDFATAGFRGAGRTIFSALPPTLLVFAVGLSVAYSGGAWLGRRTAWVGGRTSGMVTLAGVVLYTIFPPFLAFALSRWLTEPLRSLRVSWAIDPFGTLWDDVALTRNEVMLRMVVALVGTVIVVGVGSRLMAAVRTHHFLRVTATTVLTVVGWQLLGVGAVAIDVLFDAALPILGFTLLSFGEFLLISQAAMVSTMHEDFVITAHAKGLAETVVRDRHVGRNAALVVFSRMAVSLPYLLTGLVIIETALTWPGVGTFLFDAVETQDMPVVMSGLAVIGVITMLSRLGLELVIAGSDPRIVVVPELP